MKIITTTLLLLVTLTSQSQTQYISFSVDANNLLEVRNNDRMKYQINGLDFDIEVGTIQQNTSSYIFYGAFPNAYYHNYGFGLDYHFNVLQNINLYLGNQYHVVIRTGTHRDGIPVKYDRRRTTHGYVNPRAKIIISTKWITINLILKLVERNDIGIHVFEGAIGVTKRFKIKDK